MINTASDMLNRIEKRELMDNVLSKSNLTEKDALEIGRKVNMGIARKHKLVE